VTASLGFELTLGKDTDDRVDYSSDPEMAWFATSEEFKLASLAVTAPSRYRVLGTGSAAGTEPGTEAGTSTHRFTAEAVRNVAVSVGDFDVLERESGGLRLPLATARHPGQGEAVGGSDRRVDRRADQLLGPFPYPDRRRRREPAVEHLPAGLEILGHFCAEYEMNPYTIGGISENPLPASSVGWPLLGCSDSHIKG
jgi:hypothetical protein